MKIRARLGIALLICSAAGAGSSASRLAGAPGSPSREHPTAFQGPGREVLINVLASYLDLETGKRNTEPVPGTPVKLVCGDRSHTVLSDHIGRCRFSDLPAGKYTIECIPPQGFVCGDPPGRTLDVGANRPTGATVNLHIDGQISGRVVDSSGSPLSGFMVDLAAARQESPAFPRILRTASRWDGRFEFPRVPPGRYVLGIRLDGKVGAEFPYPRTYYPGVSEPGMAAVITLGTAQKLADYNLVAPPRLAARLVEGRVALSDGTPAAGALVALTVVEYPYDSPGGEVKTDAQARFSARVFEGLKYRVGAAADGDSAMLRAREQVIPAFGGAMLNIALLPAVTSKNLLLNPNADKGAQSWTPWGEAVVEIQDAGNPGFTVRGGHFSQDVFLRGDFTGSYALLIGRASTAAENARSLPVGFPCIYGYMMSPPELERGSIWEYLQGQQMCARAGVTGRWVPVYGIFRVPPKTGVIRFFLQQSSQRNMPGDPGAARFDDLGVYLFSTEQEAKLFAMRYAESYK